MDYTNPAFHKRRNVDACGTGDTAWNTVAASPYAQAVSVDSWSELPGLLDRLQDESDDYINQLQVWWCAKACDPRIVQPMRGGWVFRLTAQGLFLFDRPTAIQPFDSRHAGRVYLVAA